MCKIISPSTANIWVFVVLFSPGTVAIPAIAIYRGIYFSIDVWFITGLAYTALAFMFSFIRAQQVTLGENFIRHRKLGFFKLNTKEFNYEDLDYWKIERLTLVVVKKNGKVPDLPHGPFANLSDVLLIPSSLFMPRTKKITDQLSRMGVHERKNG